MAKARRGRDGVMCYMYSYYISESVLCTYVGMFESRVVYF